MAQENQNRSDHNVVHSGDEDMSNADSGIVIKEETSMNQFHGSDSVVHDHMYMSNSVQNMVLEVDDGDKEVNIESDMKNKEYVDVNYLSLKTGTDETPVIYVDAEFSGECGSVSLSSIPAGVALEEVLIESNGNVSTSHKQRVQRRCCVVGCGNNNTSHSMFAFPRVERLVEGVHMVDNALLKRFDTLN